jgi:hypothetical protein
MVRSISKLPLVHPAATTPGIDLAFAISAAARSGSAVRLKVCSPARSASQEIERLDSPTSTAGVELDPHAERLRRNLGKILRRRRNAVVAGLVVQKFLLAEIGIVGRGHFSDILANGDLAAEFERVAGRLAGQLDGDRQLVTEALRGAGQVLTADGEIGDKAILAVGTFCGGVADVEGRRGDVLALPGFLQDDVGVAVHQAVDRGEIARLDGARRRLGGKFHLGEGEVRGSHHQTEQAGQERAHMEVPQTGQNWRRRN